MKFLILLPLLGLGLATNYHLRQTTQCKNSYDCSSSGSGTCCRDASGHAIVEHQGGFGGFEPINSQGGTCSSMLGGSGDVCDSSCGCQSGYTCYRPMSGVCCPPMRCYNATWVEEQRKYWANCHPPTCFYPP